MLAIIANIIAGGVLRVIGFGAAGPIAGEMHLFYFFPISHYQVNQANLPLIHTCLHQQRFSRGPLARPLRRYGCSRISVCYSPAGGNDLDVLVARKLLREYLSVWKRAEDG